MDHTSIFIKKINNILANGRDQRVSSSSNPWQLDIDFQSINRNEIPSD